MKLSLGTKISLLIALLVLFSSGTIGFFYVQKEKADLRHIALGKLKNSVRAQGEKIRNEVFELVNDTKFLARTPPIQGIIRAKEGGGLDVFDGSTEEAWRQRLMVIFEGLLAEKRKYDHVRYIGLSGNGKEIVRVEQKDGKPWRVPPEKLQSKGRREYFRNAAALPKGSVYLSTISLNRERGSIEIPYKPVLRAAVPIYTPEGKVFGVLATNMFFSQVIDSLIAESPGLSIVNEDGYDLGNKNKRLTFGFDLGHLHKIQNKFPSLEGQFEKPNSDEEFTTWVDDGERKGILYFYKIRFDESKKNSFIGLVNFFEEEQILSQAESNLAEILVLVLGLIFISIIAGFYFSRKLTYPLKKISLATLIFAEREETLDMNIDSKDEIADLAKSVTNMMETVLERNKSILNQQLQLVRAKESAENANLAKSEFLSRMSHELRTPLNAVMGFAQLLQKDSVSPLTPGQLENAGRIVSAGKHLLELINEVLDLSKIEAGKMDLSIEPVDVVPVVDEVVATFKPMAEESGIALKNGIFPASCVLVEADRLRFKQVFMNLVSNAIKYNKPNGTVTLSMERLEKDKVRLGVEDTGRGIADENKVKVFQPFERLELGSSYVEGTGIGLSIAKRMVELMGGSIGFRSVVDRGSFFYIDLPLSGVSASPLDTGEKANSV